MKSMGVLVAILALVVGSAQAEECDTKLPVGAGRESLNATLACIDEKSNEALRIADESRGDTLPIGSILAWAPSSGQATPATGTWVVCGSTPDTPDLNDRFLMGVSTVHRANTTGGSNSISKEPDHKHTGTTDVVNDARGKDIVCSGNCGGRSYPHHHTFATSENGAHDHGGENRPAYYSVVFLCKTAR